MKERLRIALVFGCALVVLVIAVVGIAYVLRGLPAEGTQPNRAQVLATLLAAALIVPPVWRWAWQRRRRTVAGTSTRAEVDAAGDLLAVRTLATWSQQVVQRGIQAPAPVQVRWHWAAEDVAMARKDLAATASLATDPSPLPSAADDPSGSGRVLNSGLVSRLHNEVYARQQHGRLVLIGGPGAGKTGAMILLLIEALRHRERVPDAARAGVPVPVWLTLGSWDPSLQGLRDWVAAMVSRDHPYLRARDFGPDAVAQLFDMGRIALFLDGLDEMPNVLRSAALERLTAEATGRRVVITSRSEEYGGSIDTGPQLPYTAVVELRPVGTEAATRYLLEGQVGVTRQAWQDVADDIRAHPDGVMARTLNTPLTLSLARSAYAADDPRGLLTYELADEQTLRVHLLQQILVAAYPDPRERCRVTYWLGWLAHQMNTQPSGSTRDICWWQIPAWIGRWQFNLVRGLLVGLLVGLVGGLMGGLLLGVGYVLWDGYRLVEGLEVGLVIGLLFGPVVGLVVGLVGGLRIGAVIPPRSITIRWPTRQDLRSAVRRRPWPWLLSWVSLALGLVATLLFDDSLLGVWSSLVGVFVGALVLGLVMLLSELVEVWRVPLAAASDATPRSVYQKDVRSQLRGAVLAGFLPGPVVGLTLALGVGLTDGLMVGLVVGLGLGLMTGIMSWLGSVVWNNAASSLRFTEIVLRLHGRRVRFMPLLETALARQVLRQAGAVYQFRHADLQDRLADQYKAQLTRRPAV